MPRILAVVSALALMSASSTCGQHRSAAVPAANAESAKSASHQTRAGAPTANLGVYYFGGWSGSMANFHFEGMPDGPYQDRQPLSGWLETKTSLRSDLYWASRMGVSFFDFLYYYRASSVQVIRI